MFERLNEIAVAAVRHSEVVIAFFVLAIVFMMIMPLPTWLVDGLIALNICLATLLVIFAMYLPGPLAFSTFPGVLLLTTLFRLALSITTTRLILLQADAGNIVQAFGNFVVGGDLVVGLVIFFILTIVQFLVITKGSERIAEVAARFSLDAMPGKQMSIDSDLRAGIIDVMEAQRRRRELSRESRLFGAMDGAMKFVKGDAIASLVIVFVNLLGGMAVGTLKHGYSPAEAGHVYSVLTIGDGLVAQIPALLISLTAGMIVTRVSSESLNDAEESGNVGREMAEQMLSQPRVWMIAAGAMAVFSLVPGMPTVVFLVLAIVTFSVGFFRQRRLVALKAQAQRVETQEDRLQEIFSGQKDVRRFDPVKPYLLKVSRQFEPAEDQSVLTQVVRRTRNIIVARLGMTLPSLEVEMSDELGKNEFCFLVNEIPRLKGRFFSGQCVATADRETVERLLASAGVAMEAHAPLHGDQQETWVDARLADELRGQGVCVDSASVWLARRTEKVLLQTGAQFIGMQETAALMGWLESEQPELAKELQRVVQTSKMADVLQRLASERVSLRNLRQIAEALIEWAPKEPDPTRLTEYVRMALRFQICHEFAVNDGMRAIFFDVALQNELRAAVQKGQAGGYVAVNPAVTQHILQKLAELISGMNAGVENEVAGFPPVLVVPADVRRVVRRLIENDYFQLPVLAFTEITPEVQLFPLGEIGLPVAPSSGLQDSENGAELGDAVPETG